MDSDISVARSNDELVDNMNDANLIKTSTMERVFRAVDRGEYFLHQDTNPYKDLAWISGRFHKSASGIYSKIMESLELKSGLRFLNLGSGTGYLSTMAGLILGHNGINHGIELKDYLVQYANGKLKEFRKFSGALDEFEFCEPKFIQGNCLCLASDGYLYDRVYSSASCPPQYLDYMKSLVKVGGILIVPVNDVLLKMTRTSETGWYVHRLLRAFFATLVQPVEGSGEVVRLPTIEPLTLQELCRVKIREQLKKAIEEERPLVKQGAKLKRHNSSIPARNDDNNQDSASYEPAQNLPTSDILSNIRSNVTSCNSRSNRIRTSSENSTSTDEDDCEKFEDEIALRAYGQFRNLLTDCEEDSEPNANRPVWTDDSSDSDSEASWDDLETSSETSETESVEATTAAMFASSDSSDSDSETPWANLESSSELSETESAEAIITRHDTQETKACKAVVEKEQSSEIFAGVRRVTDEINEDCNKQSQSNGIKDECDNGILDQMTAEEVSSKIPVELAGSSKDLKYKASDNEIGFVTKMYESAYSIHMVNRIRELPLPSNLKTYLDREL